MPVYLHDVPKKALPETLRHKMFKEISFLFFYLGGKWYFDIEKYTGYQMVEGETRIALSPSAVERIDEETGYVYRRKVGYRIDMASTHIFRAVKKGDLHFHVSKNYICHYVLKQKDFGILLPVYKNKDVKLPRREKKWNIEFYCHYLVMVPKHDYFRSLTALRFLARRIHYASAQCQSSALVLQRTFRWWWYSPDSPYFKKRMERFEELVAAANDK